MIRSKGSLQRGSTVSDCDPQEKRLQHSIDTAICSFESADTHFTLPSLRNGPLPLPLKGGEGFYGYLSSQTVVRS